jgi:pimeloyl-[acyl-carrier protein] synthase
MDSITEERLGTQAINLQVPEFLENPYPFYQKLRENAPAYWFPHQGPTGGMWMATRYSDVAVLLKDERLGKDATRILPPEKLEQGQDRKDLVTSDPPDHTRLRALVNLAFTPKIVKDLEPRIRQIIAELFDQVRDRRRMDFMPDFAVPLPVIVIAELLGVPVEDRFDFRQWSNVFATSVDAVKANENSIKEGEDAAQQLMEYFKDLIKQRRAQPKGDLISALILVRDGGDRLTEEELLGMCQLLLIAGHETTVNLLGNGLLALLCHPDQLELLKKNPQYMESAVEEMLRYDSPVQRSTVRFTLEPITIAGQEIDAGQQVSAVIASANRDPLQFPDPDRFDITRNPNRHLSFGRGIHFCLGAPLARTEARLAFEFLLQEAPNIEFGEGKFVRNGNTFFRGLNSLPVKW